MNALNPNIKAIIFRYIHRDKLELYVHPELMDKTKSILYQTDRFDMSNYMYKRFPKCTVNPNCSNSRSWYAVYDKNTNMVSCGLCHYWLGSKGR